MEDTAKIQLSPSVEDYLKGIYTLTERGDSASTSALAQTLGVQPASITGMIKRLATLGYVEHLPYKGVQLTKNGSIEALRIIRRHRVLETYLQERLGYTWSEVHQEADLLEHAVSDKLISRMAKVLKDPTHDPHGAPIPTESGEIPKAHLLTLLDVRPDDLAQIEAVQDEDPIKLQYLEESGLTPGVQVKIVKRNSFDQMTTVIVLASGDLQAVSRELAEDIFVSKIRD
jgi:DtxR family Mn-dependent transcriptional regulator